MAHPEHVKAQALASLALGNTPGYVARQFGVPLSTVKRWQPEALELWAGLAPELGDLAREVTTIFPGLLQQNGPKKKKGGTR